jgi:hypothetical protein
MKTLAFLALLVAPAIAHADDVDRPARSERATYSLDIGSHVRYFGDTSAAVVTTEELAGVRLTLGRSLTRTQLRHRDVDLGVFARWAYGGVGGTMFGDLDTSIGQHLLGGGLRADAPLVRWFALNAQAELGMARTSLRVQRDEMTPVDDQHWAPYVQGSLGAELRMSEGKRLDLSLGVDFGYVITVPVELHALPGDRPAEDLSISTTFAGAGKLDTRGFSYAMSLRGRF